MAGLPLFSTLGNRPWPWGLIQLSNGSWSIEDAGREDAVEIRGKHASSPLAYHTEFHSVWSINCIYHPVILLDYTLIDERSMRPISLTTMPRAAGKKTAGQDEGFTGSLSRFWNRSYAADYLGFALLLVAYSLVRPSMFNKKSRS